MKIIAFDLGATFAWAHNSDKASGVDYFHTTLEGIREHRLAAFRLLLTDLFQRKKFDVVIYERPFARGQHATRSLWGMAGVLEECSTCWNMAVLDMPPSTIKKFATGSGKASKQDMIAAARRFGYTGDNEHEADAICLLKYAEANVEKPNV
jgi:Holliday junction resolvasome RuvABC endonuclease subunit